MTAASIGRTGTWLPRCNHKPISYHQGYWSSLDQDHGLHNPSRPETIPSGVASTAPLAPWRQIAPILSACIYTQLKWTALILCLFICNFLRWCAIIRYEYSPKLLNRLLNRLLVSTWSGFYSWYNRQWSPLTSGWFHLWVSQCFFFQNLMQ